MKKNFILVLIVVISSFISISPTKTFAAECKILGATISPSTATGSSNPNFYTQSIRDNIPVVITVTTKGCADEGKTPLYVSLTTGDTTSLINVTPGNRNVVNLNNKKITSNTEGFQITMMLPGLEGCDTATKVCKHSVRVGLEPDKYFFTSRNKANGNLDYNCPASGCSGSTWKLDATSPIKEYTPSNTATPKNGLCNTVITSQPRATKPDKSVACAEGSATDIEGTGPWNWSCLGTNGGSDVPCSAPSLSSAAAGHACGSADQQSRTTAPAGAELCALGSASLVTTTATGWSWVCTAGNLQKSCLTNKTGAAGSEEGSGESTRAAGNLLENPFKTLDTFPKIMKAVVDNIVLPIAVPFIAVMIIYSGMLFVIARRDGKVNTLDKAKQTLMYTLIGATLVLGAWVIAGALQGTLDSLVGSRSIDYLITMTRV